MNTRIEDKIRIKIPKIIIVGGVEYELKGETYYYALKSHVESNVINNKFNKEHPLIRRQSSKRAQIAVLDYLVYKDVIDTETGINIIQEKPGSLCDYDLFTQTLTTLKQQYLSHYQPIVTTQTANQATVQRQFNPTVAIQTMYPDQFPFNPAEIAHLGNLNVSATQAPATTMQYQFQPQYQQSYQTPYQPQLQPPYQPQYQTPYPPQYQSSYQSPYQLHYQLPGQTPYQPQYQPQYQTLYQPTTIRQTFDQTIEPMRYQLTKEQQTFQEALVEQKEELPYKQEALLPTKISVGEDLFFTLNKAKTGYFTDTHDNEKKRINNDIIGKMTKHDFDELITQPLGGVPQICINKYIAVNEKYGNVISEILKPHGNLYTTKNTTKSNEEDLPPYIIIGRSSGIQFKFKKNEETKCYVWEPGPQDKGCFRRPHREYIWDSETRTRGDAFKDIKKLSGLFGEGKNAYDIPFANYFRAVCNGNRYLYATSEEREYFDKGVPKEMLMSQNKRPSPGPMKQPSGLSRHRGHPYSSNLNNHGFFSSTQSVLNPPPGVKSTRDNLPTNFAELEKLLSGQNLYQGLAHSNEEAEEINNIEQMLMNTTDNPKPYP